MLDITDVSCVFEGDLVEVDPETFLPRSKVHAFLLHDSMIVANIIQNRSVQVCNQVTQLIPNLSVW